MRIATLAIILPVLLALDLAAQLGPCPTRVVGSLNPPPTLMSRSSKLICLVPQLYGPGGLVGFYDKGPLLETSYGVTLFPDVDFQSAGSEISRNLIPLLSEVGTQLSHLPSAAPVSGLLFSFSPSAGVDTEVTQNLGPILSERPSTLGRHKLFVGVSYEYFNFEKVDGISLKNFAAVLTHEQDNLGGCPSSGVQCYNGLPLFGQDIISTQNRIDLKIHQVTAVAAFGLTNRLDVSVDVPIVDVRMSMTATATIHSFETYPAGIDGRSCYDNPLSSAPNNTFGCMNQFADLKNTGLPLVPGEVLLTPSPYPFLQDQAQFSSSNSVSGIGDVTVRGKIEAIKRERLGLALGLELHLPTGDAENFLGSGSFGVRPFAAVGYSGRIEPHASIGFQVNLNSILAGDITGDAPGHLPNVLDYDAGVDTGISRRFSLSADLLGQTLIHQFEISKATFTDYSGAPEANLRSSRVNSNQLGLALGGKVKPFGKLIITGNILLRLNEAGLHSKPAPLIGLSYMF
jgi:outer membrane putative beta-barrel porin/alpha-amylase